MQARYSLGKVKEDKRGLTEIRNRLSDFRCSVLEVPPSVDRSRTLHSEPCETYSKEDLDY